MKENVTLNLNAESKDFLRYTTALIASSLVNQYPTGTSPKHIAARSFAIANAVVNKLNEETEKSL